MTFAICDLTPSGMWSSRSARCRWRGRRSAIMAIVGFGVLIFTFLGVNFFMEGHHKGFTK